MTTKYVTLLGAVLFSLLATKPAHAQQCDKCYNSGDADMHVFGNAGFWYTYMHADCNSFNGCHGNSQPGSCSGNHWGCGVSLAILVERLNTGISRGDVTRTGALIAANPTLVKFDRATGRVSVRDCDGRPVMAWSWQSPITGAGASRNPESANPSTNRRTA